MYFIAHDIVGVAAAAAAAVTAVYDVVHIYLISWRFTRIKQNSNE